MVTHLSVRLCWHDSGWNGRICKYPEKNSFCSFLDHIRDHRNATINDFEEKNRERHLSEFNRLERRAIPCRGEICTFSEIGYNVEFDHPLKERKVPGYDLAPCVIEGAHCSTL